MADKTKAMLFKEEGNRHFQAGDFLGAESLYSKAIIADPRNAVLYTNRAMARLKLKMWESVTVDCNECLELAPENQKARYYLAQAQVEMGAHDEAVRNALAAHKLCVGANDTKSLGLYTVLVRRCKKERWDALERRRAREDADLEGEVVRMMERERDEALASSPEDRVEVEGDHEAKLARIRRVFEKARSPDARERKVPDWAIDDIGFDFMVDPVITKTGKSYERATIMEHLKRSPTDPITREPLLPHELRPNLGLKEACNDFLDKNGWAADW